MMETTCTRVWKYRVLTVQDYEVCQGFLQQIVTAFKKHRGNLEEGLEKISHGT